MASSIPRLGTVAFPHLDADRIQKPLVVDGDHPGARGDSLPNLAGDGNRNGRYGSTGMGVHSTDSRVSVIQMGLEDLDIAADHQRRAYPPDQLFGPPGVHDPGNDLDPPAIPSLTRAR